MKRAIEKYDVNVIGLTLSKNQHAYTSKVLDEVDTNRSHRVLLRGWEQFSEPVDRIVSIEAIEHFGFERFDDFYKNAVQHHARRRADDDSEHHRPPSLGMGQARLGEQRGSPFHQVHPHRDLPRRSYPECADVD